MARALLQSVVLPTAVASGTWSHLQGSRKGKSYVPIMDAVCASPVRLQSFSGLHKSNMLDLKSRNVKDFWSVVSSAISKTLGKATRGVVVAMLEHYTEKAIKVIMLAQEEARRLGHNFVGTEQILIGLISEGTGIASEVLESMDIDLEDARDEVENLIGEGGGSCVAEIPFTPRAKRVLELSLVAARQLGNNYICSQHLLVGLLHEGAGVGIRVLKRLGADPKKIYTQVIHMVGGSTEAIGSGVSGESSLKMLPTLNKYGTDLSNLAKQGKLDPVVGRQDQIERLTQILVRRRKSNPCLIGEPGVGKTAMAEGLAQLIADGCVPERMKGKKVLGIVENLKKD